MQKLIIAFALIFILLEDPNSLHAQIIAPRVDYVVGLRPYSLVCEDFDNDGDFDIATAPGTALNSDGIGWVTVLKNNGNGTFSAPESIRVGDIPTIASADLNNDGFVDMVAADFSTNRVYILFNNGTGSFVVADSFPSGGLQPSDLCTADLDRDGEVDLIVPNTGSDNIAIFFNNGNATFTGPVTHTVGDFPLAVVSADIDRDGDSDLVVTNNHSGTVSVMLNDSSGGFPSQTLYAVGTHPQMPSLADYNGDGCLDLAVPNAGPSTPYVSVFMGNCDGIFDPRVDYSGFRPHAVASGDFDLDGDIDMAVANNESNSVSIFLNDGSGTFAPPLSLAAGTGPNHVIARDLDRDGDLDFVTDSFDNDGNPGNCVSVFINYPLDVRVSPERESLDRTRDSVRIAVRPHGDARGLSFSVQFEFPDNHPVDTLTLYDDGTHGDSLASDGLFANTWVPGDSDEYYLDLQVTLHDTLRFELNNIKVFSPVTVIQEEASGQPGEFALQQNYPNPFNPTTGIRYQVPGVSDVRITVYDLLGREVAVLVNERKQPGSYEVTFDGSESASGVYICRLTAGQYIQSRKMILVK